MRQAPLPERPRVRKLHETMFEFLRADGPGRRECVGNSIFPRPEGRADGPEKRECLPVGRNDCPLVRAYLSA